MPLAGNQHKGIVSEAKGTQKLTCPSRASRSVKWVNPGEEVTLVMQQGGRSHLLLREEGESSSIGENKISLGLD